MFSIKSQNNCTKPLQFGPSNNYYSPNINCSIINSTKRRNNPPPVLYTVTYNANGATGGTVPIDNSSPYKPRSTVTVFNNPGALEYLYYTMIGWNTKADGTGIFYPLGLNNSFRITGNTILYAVYIDE